MRRIIGCLVFVGGVVGLGYVATSNHAVRVQTSIAQDAQIVTSQSADPISVRVSGRDITVSGRTTDQADVDALEADLLALDGVRTVDVTGMETLPFVEPYEMQFDLKQGHVSVQGVVPSEAAVVLFAGADTELQLAAGVPDGDWVDVARRTAGALTGLQSGRAMLSGRVLRIEGVALTPSNHDDILAALGALPQGYRFDNQISVEDDGAPLSLNITLDEGRVVALGKFPSDMPLSDFSDRFDQINMVRIDQATIPSANPEWPNVTRTAMDALAGMVEGHLVVQSQDVSLTGRATPAGKSQAEAMLAGLPDTFIVGTEISLWDDGAPLTLAMDWDGNRATTIGKFPADFTPRGPAGVAVVDDARRSFLPDTGGAFTQNVDVGVTALGFLESGLLEVTADRIVLSGAAATPQVEAAIDSFLANAAPNTEVERSITYLDDGSPAAWTLTYSAQAGAQVNGRLPVGLSLADIASNLGVTPLEGEATTALSDENTGTSLQTLATVAQYLPEVETMTYARDGDGSALDLVMSPGVDVDLIAVDLAAILPSDVAFSLSPLSPLPVEGAVRRNAVTGLSEVFTGGFWLPDLEFTTDVAGCTQISATVLAQSKINFLSGSARLDATSIRAINAIASIARTCLGGGLRLEIGGHTDATGDADSNDDLSFDRAAEVRAALIDRGVTADLMTPVGYGQTQPIADNATPEGRATNRRTTLVWTQP